MICKEIKYNAWEIRFDGLDFHFKKDEWSFEDTAARYIFKGKAPWNQEETWSFPQGFSSLRIINS
jgi:hypothetical protein